MPSSLLYEEILDILYEQFKEHKISKVELERMIDSQFRVVRKCINNKQAEVTLLPYLGKIIPTVGHRRYINLKRKQENEQTKGDN